VSPVSCRRLFSPGRLSLPAVLIFNSRGHRKLPSASLKFLLVDLPAVLLPRFVDKKNREIFSRPLSGAGIGSFEIFN